MLVDSVNTKNFSYRTPEQARAEWTEKKMNATAWLDDNSGTIGPDDLLDQTVRLRRLQRLGTDSQSVSRAPQQGRIAGRFGRGDEQEVPSVLGQRLEAPQKAGLDPS